jgi:predicted 3-demethylubiquinone-9 3-methyltransferase (glyoxalase superfamily)
LNGQLAKDRTAAFCAMLNAVTVFDSHRDIWLKDKYGLSWQVCPDNWEEVLSKKPGAFQKMMGMKKIIIADF